ncbi:glycosyltransferase family 2 protein [Conexibacter sp. SYSU D00693]|uniref:glycosyltransferase family 2 protein n=1 Tax=Conexibacter sp. SYSU D00693 TaxID=2812560 RepID=UPI00196BAC5A|nr:glycosyltransferase [Conexibacter sp. SYSU D00693]
MPRPPVSVVLPFHGTTADAEEALAALRRLDLREEDEVLVVDNTGKGVVPQRDGVRVVDAPREPSSYYARNEGAAVARHEWLLLLDADCVPRPDLADRYFDEEPDERCGAVVGEVEAVEGQTALVARYARSRGHLGQKMHMEWPFRPWGVTANMLVRKAAWASVGGFQEGVRSGGDTEFSWRLQDAGWTLEYRPQAAVAHAHRESVKALARQAARYAAGRRWVMSRYPGSFERPTIARDLARCAAGIVVWTLTLQPQRALFKALDGVYVTARWPAFLLSNTPPGSQTVPRADIAVVAGAFPAQDDPAPLAVIDEQSAPTLVDAQARPVRVDRAAARRLAIRYAEDDGHLRRVEGLARLAARPWTLLRARRAVDGFGALLALAPRAHRLRLAGVRRIVAATSQDEPTARALRLLTGAH